MPCVTHRRNEKNNTGLLKSDSQAESLSYYIFSREEYSSSAGDVPPSGFLQDASSLYEDPQRVEASSVVV
jgi:hypothetical protein